MVNNQAQESATKKKETLSNSSDKHEFSLTLDSLVPRLFCSISYNFLHLNLGKPQVGGHCLPSLQQKDYILQVLTDADLSSSSWAGDTPTSFDNSSRVIPDMVLQEI